MRPIAFILINMETKVVFGVNKLLKPIKALVAIMLTLPAIYLPFRIQNVYKHLMSLVAYRLKNCKSITNLVIIQKQEHDWSVDGRNEE